MDNSLRTIRQAILAITEGSSLVMGRPQATNYLSPDTEISDS